MGRGGRAKHQTPGIPAAKGESGASLEGREFAGCIWGQMLLLQLLLGRRHASDGSQGLVSFLGDTSQSRRAKEEPENQWNKGRPLVVPRGFGPSSGGAAGVGARCRADI